MYTIQHVSVERMHVSKNKMKSLIYLSTNLIDMTFFVYNAIIHVVVFFCKSFSRHRVYLHNCMD